MWSPTEIAVGSAFLGLSSHLIWFMHGEHDFLARHYVVLWGCSQACLFYLFTQVMGQSCLSASIAMSLASVVYLGALFSSIIVYRVFFHRLRRFPGPVSWKMSKITHALKNGDYAGFRHLDDLHQQYGQFVRTGPSEISVIDPSVCPKVLGPGSKCGKGLWYDMGQPLISVHQTRNKRLHDIRRKVWDKGFNARSLRSYEPRISTYVDLLMNQIKACDGKRLSASKWFHYFSFDAMGDLAFGKSFNMLEKGKSHFAIPLLQEGMKGLNIGPAIPWLFYLATAVPALAKDYFQFLDWSAEQAEKRKQIKMDEPDIMSHIIDAPPMSNDAKTNSNWMLGDTRLIIVAGSDTVAAAMTYCVHELIKRPDIVQKLRAEVKPFINNGQVDYQGLQQCKYLDAVIDETLRLYPPVPAGVIRVTPPEGIAIGETYIPGNTNMILPLYSIQRSPRAFVEPNEFIPERWTSKPDLIKETGAWAPFSMGAFGCVGKSLAYMEMRAVISRLVTEFEIAFAENEDGSDLINKSHDNFTVHLADLWITCKPITS